MSNFLTNTARLSHPPSKVLTFLQTPATLLSLNALCESLTQTYTNPPTSTFHLRLKIPILFGLLRIPITTAAVIENTDDGVYVLTHSPGVKASSRWTVLEEDEGCTVVEEFCLHSVLWGLGWFVMRTAEQEHSEVFRTLEERVRGSVA